MWCGSNQVFEIKLSNLLARKLQNYNIYIDSIKNIWQKSLAVSHRTTAKVKDWDTFCKIAPIVAAPFILVKVSLFVELVCNICRKSVRNPATWFCSSLVSEKKKKKYIHQKQDKDYQQNSQIWLLPLRTWLRSEGMR